MASFKDSFFSKLSGKVGNVNTYILNGKQVVRANPIPNDPKTPKQLAHRMKFALVNKGLSPLNRSIKLGHRDDTNAYRSLVGKAYREAIVGEYPDYKLDYSKLVIANGNLQPPSNIKLEMDVETNSALFWWDKQNLDSLKPSRNSDQLNIVVFNVKHNVADHISEIAKRSDSKISIVLPVGWSLVDIHFWAYFSSHTLQMNSVSVYIL